MKLSVNDRVYWQGELNAAEGPSVAGTVLKVKARDGEALVAWDDDGNAEPRWYWIEDLGLIDRKRRKNPPLIYAPEIQDLEFITRIDPKTNSLMMERDAAYRGDATPKPIIDSSKDIYRYFKGMSELDREHIVIFVLNVRQELTGWKIAHVGQLEAVEASAREMVKDAVFAIAHSMGILHNHPSGDPSPSEADEKLTVAIEYTANCFEVMLFDHVIIGRKTSDHPAYFSFRDAGKLDELGDRVEDDEKEATTS